MIFETVAAIQKSGLISRTGTGAQRYEQLSGFVEVHQLMQLKQRNTWF
jgi:hypothetical protein